MTVTQGGSFRIAADHPCLTGHFPGRPVVPGAVLLDETFARLVQAVGASGGIDRLVAAKFLRPVLPGETVEIVFEHAPGGIAFRCSVGALLVLHGTARLGPAG